MATDNQTIVISDDKEKLNVDFVHAELAQKYWSKDIPRHVVDVAIANSLCFGVYLQDSWQQIGFARAVTDFATFAYLADVFILDDYQGRGYGKRLMQEIKAHPRLQGLRRWMLITRDAHSLYKQFEFAALAHPERAMEFCRPNIYQSP